jgi:U3 small nucleolar RNA-associated protein 23
VTTSCVIAELRQKYDNNTEALNLARKMERRRCPHKTPVSGSECIASIIGNAYSIVYRR